MTISTPRFSCEKMSLARRRSGRAAFFLRVGPMTGRAHLFGDDPEVVSPSPDLLAWGRDPVGNDRTRPRPFEASSCRGGDRRTRRGSRRVAVSHTAIL